MRLNKILGTSAVLYTCSGSESIEAAIKTCRKYQLLKVVVENLYLLLLYLIMVLHMEQ